MNIVQQTMKNKKYIKATKRNNKENTALAASILNKGL